MKFLVILSLIACTYAELSLTEYKAEYGAIPITAPFISMKYKAPTGAIPIAAPLIAMKYKAPTDTIPVAAPLIPFKDPYYQWAPKAYTIPKGYRLSYDPENFNEAFGFYPEN